VEKCKTEENLSKFLNNMAYKTVTSMWDCVMKRNIMLNMKSFYFDKRHMLYNQNKSYVKSCQKFCFKNPLFSKENHCFPTCALFYPIDLKRKIITGLETTSFYLFPPITTPCPIKFKNSYACANNLIKLNAPLS